MTKRLEVGGDVNKTTGGDDIMYTPDYIRNNSRDYIAQYGGPENISFNNPKKPPVVDEYFVHGWWSLDREGKKFITSAFPGMLVYFQLETKNIRDNERVFLTMMEYDNSVKRGSGTGGDKIMHINSMTDGSILRVN